MDRMLNSVETSLKMLVKETNFGKYKRWCEVHFISQRRKVWEEDSHSGIPCIVAGVNEVTHSAAWCSGAHASVWRFRGEHKVIKSSFIKLFFAGSYLEKLNPT